MAFANDGAMFHRRLVYKDVGNAPGTLQTKNKQGP